MSSSSDRSFIVKTSIMSSSSDRPFIIKTNKGHSVTNSLSRPHHHKGRIPQWAQESPSSLYIRRKNVLDTCGDFFDQSYVEGSRRPWRSLHNCRRCWKCTHMCGRVWKNVEDHEMWKSSLESSMVVLYIHVHGKVL